MSVDYRKIINALEKKRVDTIRVIATLEAAQRAGKRPKGSKRP